MSTQEKDRVSSHEVDSDENASSVEEAPPPKQRRSKKKAKSSRRKQQSGPLDNLPLGGDSAGGALGGVTNTLGGVTGQALDQKGGGGGGGDKDTLRLRLDLNLDIEIQLKARIHGDLELALLYVSPDFLSRLPLPLALCLTCHVTPVPAKLATADVFLFIPGISSCIRIRVLLFGRALWRESKNTSSYQSIQSRRWHQEMINKWPLSLSLKLISLVL
jgi:hypothetical protein